MEHVDASIWSSKFDDFFYVFYQIIFLQSTVRLEESGNHTERAVALEDDDAVAFLQRVEGRGTLPGSGDRSPQEGKSEGVPSIWG